MSMSVNGPGQRPDQGDEQGNTGSDELTALFAVYREACPDVTGGADFLPGIWRKIEARQGFWFSFEHLARGFAAVAVVMCLLLVALNFTSSQVTVPSMSYADALASEHTAERTYYAEGIRTTTPADSAPPADTSESPAR